MNTKIDRFIFFKNLCLITFFTLFSLFFSCKVFAQNISSEPFDVKAMPSQNIRLVNISTFGGEIIIIGTASSEIKISTFVRSKEKQLDSNKIREIYANNYEVKTSVLNGILDVSAATKNNTEVDLSIGFKLEIPSAISVTLNTKGGGLLIEGMLTTLTGFTAGGGIKIHDCKGSLNFVTEGGGIEVKNSEGFITLHTDGGGIELDALKGHISASSGGGAIIAKNIRESINLHTNGGSLYIENVNGDISAYTADGDIKASFYSINSYAFISNGRGDINISILDPDHYSYEYSALKILDINNFVTTRGGENIKHRGDKKIAKALVKINCPTGVLKIDKY